MNSMAMLDIAIGMIFIYLLLALLCSALQEVLSRMLKWRGNNLRLGIQTLLNDTNSAFFAEQFYKHPLIDSLAVKKGSPSYLHASYFSSVMMDLLEQQSKQNPYDNIVEAVSVLPDGNLKQSLQTIVRRSKGDVDVFVSGLEQWFDHGMDRAAGWYKRKSQQSMFVIALVITIIFNVNSFQVLDALWHEPLKRAAIVAMAEQTDVSQNSNNAEAIQKGMAELQLPIGWGSSSSQNKLSDAEQFAGYCDTWTMLTHAVGWLVTACFVSLGAPFWFNTLEKVLAIRATGKKPARSLKQP